MGILSGISIISIYLISLEYLHQQLRKEKRKNAYEMQKLLASNQRLKMVKPCFLYDNISLLFFFWEGMWRGGGGEVSPFWKFVFLPLVLLCRSYNERQKRHLRPQNG